MTGTGLRRVGVCLAGAVVLALSVVATPGRGTATGAAVPEAGSASVFPMPGEVSVQPEASQDSAKPEPGDGDVSPDVGGVTDSPEEVGFRVSVKRAFGWPGDTVVVTFDDFAKGDGRYLAGCRVRFADDEDRFWECPASAEPGMIVPFVSATVPPGARTEPTVLHWRLDYRVISDVIEQEAVPDTSLTGQIPFSILRVDVAALPRTVAPGGTVTVGFTSRSAGLTVTDCTVRLGRRTVRCDGTSAAVTVPATAVQGRDLTLEWRYTAREPDGTITRRPPDTPGRLTVHVGLLDPEFSVTPSSTRAGPGEPFVTRFTSRTRGVTVDTCRVVVAGRDAACSPGGVAVVLIPPTVRDGSVLTAAWELSYTSSRAGEEPGIRRGTFPIRIVIAPPVVAVVVQPASAAPGEPVVVTLASLRPDVRIVGCQVAFAGDQGAVCPDSPTRWVARTRVPGGTAPGATLLRWAVSTTVGDGRPGVADGVIAFPVLGPVVIPSRPPVRPSTPPPPTDEPTDSSTDRPTGSSTDRPTGSSTDEPTDEPTDSSTDGQADGSTGGSTGGQSGGSTTTAGTTQTTKTTENPPLFDAHVDPESVVAGKQASVTLAAIDQNVEITGCRARFTVEGAETACSRTPGGNWTAVATVPEKAAPGIGTLHWAVDYTLSGNTTQSADGLVTLGVLAPQPDSPSWLAALLRIGLAGVLLGGLVALKAGASRVRTKWRQAHPTQDPAPEGHVGAVLCAYPEKTNVTVSDPHAAPRQLIRIRVDRGRPTVRLREEFR
ncbi:PT domain-containing protein [Actinoplanes rectilineatus]|uniref:PT domain-containing protein n=1 Tax=Actinoplanes rectilineatus TaxID=113571 RepID=UPI000B262415|nr:PT domain-containing protein [Actinoplanes rectilineatus]